MILRFMMCAGIQPVLRQPMSPGLEFGSLGLLRIGLARPRPVGQSCHGKQWEHEYVLLVVIDNHKRATWQEGNVVSQARSEVCPQNP